MRKFTQQAEVSVEKRLAAWSILFLTLSLVTSAKSVPSTTALRPTAIPFYRVTNLGALGGHRFASNQITNLDETCEAFINPSAINERGEIVGYQSSLNDDKRITGFFWRRGRMWSLAPQFEPKTITNAGKIYGTFRSEKLWKDDINPIFLWSRQGLALVQHDPITERRATIHFSEKMPDVAVVPETHEKVAITHGGNLLCVNAKGQGVGALITLERQIPIAGIWQHDQAFVLLAFGGFFEEADGINDRGQIVGMGGGGVDGPTAAFWPDWQVPAIDLNTRIKAGSGWHLEYACAINNRGQIVGIGRLWGRACGFLLTPMHNLSEQRLHDSFSSH